jgi:hypothetical protein
VTAEHLGGATRFELAAFRMACVEYLLDAEVPHWTAIAVTYDAGTWREGVGERCPLAWQLAQRLTAEERQQGPRRLPGQPAPSVRLWATLGR